MKIFAFAYNRFDTMTTSVMLKEAGLEHLVLCHSEEDHEKFLAGGTIGGEVVVTGNAKGLAYQRNSALDMMDEDEWALFLVDDLKSVTELDDYEERGETIPVAIGNTTEWGRRFHSPVGLDKFVDVRCAEAIEKAEQEGARLVGFAGYNNPLFRASKWKFNALADGRCWLVKKSHLRFDEKAQMVDDVCWTALNMREFGIVVINQWILPDCQRYTKGAFGSVDERVEAKRAEVTYLTTAYPELIRPASKPGWPEGTHLKLRKMR